MTSPMQVRWLVVVALTTGACGDNEPPDLGPGQPLAPASDLTIIAHQDDDLLFMQPDLYDAVKRGGGLTNVYVTAGNGRHGVEAAEPRYDGLMSAYGEIAGDQDWACGWIMIGAINVEHCRLAAEKISLVFLAYPDGGTTGEVTDSLLHLWEGKIASAATVARRSSTYTQASLIQVLGAIIDVTAPTTLRTLEIASTHGYDHSDHMLVGALAVLATAHSSRAPALISYRGYDIGSEPANLDAAVYDRSVDIMLRYDACATGCAPCGEACALDQLEPEHSAYLQRRYPIGVGRTAMGTLRQGDGCVIAMSAGANAVIGDCATAPAWQLDELGTLRNADNICLEVFLTGEITANTCRDAGPAGRFFLDDEGHLWSGVVPPQQDDMDYAHLYCVGSAGGRPRAGLCGQDRAPTWTIAP